MTSRPLGRPLALFGLLASVGALAAAPSPAARPDWQAGVSQVLGRELAAIRLESPGVFSSIDPRGLTGRYDGLGVRLGHEEDETGLTLVGFGRADMWQDVAPVDPVFGACGTATGADGACLRRVEYDRDGLVEWWQAVDAGVEQGFDVLAAPPGRGPLALALALDGAEALIDDDGVAAWLDGDRGGSLRLDGLAAWDADGDALDVWLEPDAAGLRIVVDDSGATYPITVDPLYTTASSTLTQPTAASGYSTSYFGMVVSAAGDVNGDGYDDLIVGQPYYYKYSSTYGVYYYDGRAMIYTGSSSGLKTTASVTLTGNTGSGSSYTYNYFGVSVAGIGDMDGDGYDDVAVGEPGYGSTGKGMVHVFAGSSSGVDTTADWTATGSDDGKFFGGQVVGLGDLDADGYGDLGVANNFYRYYYDSSKLRYTSEYGGAFRVYLGGYKGLTTTAKTTISTLTTSYNVYYHAAAAGDVNGDGYDDVVVADAGAPVTISGSTYYYRGKATVYYGSSSGLKTTGGTTVYGKSATSTSSSGYFGVGAGVGDLDGDGYDDVAINEPNYYDSASSEYYRGYVHVFHGSSSGLKTTATSTLRGEDYDYLGGQFQTIGHSVYRADPYLSASGYEVFTQFSRVGDVSGDGYDDLVIPNPSDYVAAVYAGSASGVATTATQSIKPGTSGFAVYGVDGAGDVNGDGFADIAVGAPYANYVLVYHGYDDDVDDDGYKTDEDCDDADPDVNPGATEEIGDEFDQNCDGAELCYVDADGDGYRTEYVVYSGDDTCTATGEAAATAPIGDCDDSDKDMFPGSKEDEIGDGVDHNCDGVEACYVDADGDGWRTETYKTGNDNDCTDPGEAYESLPVGDCDDGDPNRNPSRVEILADGFDSDCNLIELCYVDLDADGFRTDAVIESYDTDCNDEGEAWAVETLGDCNDGDGNYHPGAEEVCGETRDLNCDGTVDYVDGDSDGIPACNDCDDGDATASPNQVEICDGKDNDCDGSTDNNPLDGEVFYADADGDGFPDPILDVVACDVPAGYVVPGGLWDCNDAEAGEFPGGVEVADDGLDNDCVGGDAPPPPEEKSCSTGGMSPIGAAALASALLLRRRRQR